MAGIYIHIPFCKQACHYCDFHFSTLLKNKMLFVNALLEEIDLQKNYFPPLTIINTIYFGGGTPSLLSNQELTLIFEKLYATFNVHENAEITLEANPDDLNENKLKELKDAGINRLSIGIQSFFDEDLKLMNRAHSADESKNCVMLAQKNGFDNITIDLMYGLPTLSNDKWLDNLHASFELNIKHISAYCLTIEPKTALATFVKTGKVKNVDEQIASEQFNMMLQEMDNHGFIQYEISNFCKDEMYSRHNSNYWLKSSYLGLGPSAHSYNGISRKWNISNNQIYIQSLQKKILPFEEEQLSIRQRYNEYVLTSLRTIWGTDINYIAENFGNKFRDYFLQNIQPYIKSGHVYIHSKYYLTRQGKLLADKIASDLFVVD